MKKQKFKHLWAGQTEIGKRFGLSAIALGKILIEHGLKDPVGKGATQQALNRGFALSTPLKDGTPYYMWSIQKVSSLLGGTVHQPLSKVDYWVNEVQQFIREINRMHDEGQDKMAYLATECLFDDVPKKILAEVKEKVKASGLWHE